MDLRTILNAVTTVQASGAAQTLTASTGTGEDPVYDLTLTADCALTLAATANGRQQTITVYVRQDATGGRALALPAGILWPAGIAPTLTSVARRVDVLRFATLDAVTWMGSVVALNLVAPAIVIEEPARVQSDGTPQVGEPLLGIDPVVTGTSVVSRRWLLGSTVLATVNAYTAAEAGLFVFEALGPGDVVLSSVQVDVAAAGTPTPPPALANKVIAGANMDYVKDGAVTHPFLDRMKTARAWTWSDGSSDFLLDAQYIGSDGWPTSLPSGAAYLSTKVASSYQEENAPTRRFNVNFPGNNGAIAGSSANTALVSQAAGRAVLEDVNNGTDPDSRKSAFLSVSFLASAITDFATFRPTIVRQDRQALYDSGERWSPNFLAKVKEMDVLRFMNWVTTNYSTLADWAKRPKPSWCSYAANRDPAVSDPLNTSGVPFEHMIELANRLKADGGALDTIWVNVPHLADQTFRTSMAQLFQTTLDPAINLAVEYSNEVWNPFFPAYHYLNSTLTAKKAVPGNDIPSEMNLVAFNGYSQALAVKDFIAVFEAAGQRARLRPQLGVLGVAPAMAEELASGATFAGCESLPATGFRNVNEAFVDFAGTAYIGGLSVKDQADQQIVKTNFLDPPGDTGFLWALDVIRGNITYGTSSEAHDSLPTINGFRDGWNAKRQQYGMGYSHYEWSISANADYSWADNFGATVANQVLAKEIQLMLRPEMRQIMREAIDQGAERGVSMLCFYKLFARPGLGESGTFNMFYSEEQDPATSPRFQGLQDYRAARKPRLALNSALSATVNNPVAAVGATLPLIFTVRGGDGPPYRLTKLSGIIAAGRAISGLQVKGQYTTEQADVSAVFRVFDRNDNYVDVPVTQTVGPAQAVGFRYLRLEGISNGAIEAGTANHRTALGEWELLDGQGNVIPWPAGTTFTTVDGIEGQFGPASYPAAVGDGDRGTFFTDPDGTTPGYAGQMRVYATLPEGTKVRPAAWRFKSAADSNFEWAPVRFRGYATNTAAQLKAEGVGTLICDRSGAVSPGANPANNPLGYGAGANGGVTFACVYP